MLHEPGFPGLTHFQLMAPIYEFIDAVNTASKAKWLAVVAKAATAAAALNGTEQCSAIGDLRELSEKFVGVEKLKPSELQEAFELPDRSASVEAAAVTVCKRTFGDLALTKALAPELSA